MMDWLNSLVGDVNSVLWGVFCLIPLLCGTGIFYTIRLRFVQVRKFGLALKILFGGASLFGKRADKTGMSSFQALATAIAAQVGTGNVAGTATAIVSGGPGALFWLWVAAFFGMATIFAEAVLAQTYRDKDANGHIVGGPAYYITKGMGEKFRPMAVFFSIAIIIALGCIGNAVQSNSISMAMKTAFDMPLLITGVVVAVLSGFVFFGGIGRLASVTEKIVPAMAAIYIVGGTWVICMHAAQIIPAFELIIEAAFNPQAVAGGALGLTIAKAMQFGVARGLFSNEAGMGSAPNVAATAHVTHPVKQGLIQALGVFTDTLIICTCTAFIILFSGVSTQASLNGIQLTQEALTAEVGSAGGIFIALAILLFAFSSIIGNYYYGEANILFITRRKPVLVAYRLLVSAMVLCGSLMSLDLAWSLADIMMGLMTICNLIAIAILSRQAFLLLDHYLAQKRKGISSPVFRKEDIPELEEEAECW